MPGPKPRWQPEPCPHWCVRDHDESDIPLDRYHQGPPSLLPVAMSARPEEPRSDSFETVELTLRVGRYAGEVVDWVAVEPVDVTAPRIVLTAESADRLAHRVEELLTVHAAE